MVNQDTDVRIESEELRRAIADDFAAMLKQTADALNNARDGAIIADSEWIVREALAAFRQQVYQTAVQLKAAKAAAAAFSPSAQRQRDVAQGQGTGERQSSDGQ